uniref:Large ribosomal subunit protein P1 n=1 Tax=Magallana gigas TaxID=29159 RepID=K1QN55_MAGGI
MASSDELACVYAALILADDQVAITSDKIATILKAAGVSVEPYWPSLFSKALDGVNVKEMISNISSGAGAAPAAAAAPAAQAAAPADDKKGNIGTQNQERNQMDRKGRGIKLKEIAAKKEEKKEESESDEDMGFVKFHLGAKIHGLGLGKASS